MAVYSVKNQWGGSSAPWHDGGSWVLGARDNQNVVAMDIKSNDGGQTFTGTMTYEGEGPIGFKATNVAGNTYTVENQWGGSSAPWHDGGTMLIGGRNQKCVQLNFTSKDGNNLTGTMTYEGEGPIGFNANISEANAYIVQNRWGGTSAPWHPGGVWVVGCRGGQHVVAVDVNSTDKGNTLTGTNTYSGEGPIGFKGVLRGDNAGGNYTVENQWGGSSAPWHPGGTWVIGTRFGKQNVVQWAAKSSDNGQTLEGTMTYEGEGPISFKAELIQVSVEA
ncbi:MAG: lectin ESA-2 [Bacteroidota bacterium]